MDVLRWVAVFVLLLQGVIWGWALYHRRRVPTHSSKSSVAILLLAYGVLDRYGYDLTKTFVKDAADEIQAGRKPNLGVEKRGG